MSLNFDDIAIDPKLAQTGAWMDYMGGRFLLARKGQEYNAAVGRMYLENRDIIEGENKIEGGFKLAEIYRTAFVDHVLLDWDKIVDKEKNPVPYTREHALQLLADPRMFEFAQELERFSLMHHNYREITEEQVAEEVKNTAVS